MKIKTKIIIFAIIVILAIVVGLFINMMDFNHIQEETENTKTTETLKKKQDPILELTQDEVILEVGSTFSYRDFIKRAENEDGYNLKDKVKAPDEIPTDVPGEYQVEYILEVNNGKTISKQLTLKVVEYEKGVNPD